MNNGNGMPSDVQQGELPPGAMANPSPLGMSLEIVSYPEGNIVRLRVESATGMSLFFLPPDYADEMGKQLRKAAREAKLGLTIVGETRDVFAVPDDVPLGGPLSVVPEEEPTHTDEDAPSEGEDDDDVPPTDDPNHEMMRDDPSRYPVPGDPDFDPIEHA